ncbi:ClpP/crotonase [Exidia glandulosa HHB12029]|uniref:ClpP/crotonase n=1 Tax=Exidia glandulosa HHB12029 TaxID=1314781 RepID=A0A165GVA0_EXIGL|nr:ClpP/crotonase [Exidia glandulosa HHB12029]
MAGDITVDVKDGIATITLNRPETLNALTRADYDAFAKSLREIDQRPDVVVTIWQAHGRFFCAGTNVADSASVIASKEAAEADRSDPRKVFPSAVFPTNTDVSNALYTHSKLLVAAVNGPVLGIAAAFLGFFDFIYAMPSVYLSVPFTFLGLISEAGSSVSFVNRMGLARANEVLLLRKRLGADDLLQCGFVNKIFPAEPAEKFHATVRAHVQYELEGLDPTALLAVKRLIRAGLNEKNNPDAVNMRESYEQASRIASGIPAQQFSRLARKEIKNRL